MALLDLQALLAQLYTESGFRDRFFDDPEAACRGLLLAEAERRQLAGLDRRQVERFARSLKQKRLGSVRQLLPATAHTLGDLLRPLFFEYCEQRPSAPPHLEDGQAFLRHLLSGEAPPALLRQHAHLPDLLACERLRLDILAEPTFAPARAALPRSTTLASSEPQVPTFPRLTGRARLARFDYDMEALHPRASRGEAVEWRLEPCFILLGKLKDAPRVKLKRVNDATARLLLLSDGRRTLAGIVRELSSGLELTAAQEARFFTECAALLGQLSDSGLVVLDGIGRNKEAAGVT